MVVSRVLVIMSMTLLQFRGGCDAALPSLKLGFNIKRPSMAVRGATTFDVLVTPVVSGDNVIFNGKVSIDQDGTTHSFYLVDNVPYHEIVNSSGSKTTCQSSESIPNVYDVVDAITSATPVSSVNTDQDISCRDLSVSFEYLLENVVITKPADSPSNCNAIDTTMALSSLAKIYGKPLVSSHRMLKGEARSAQLASPICTCRSKRRPCLFFHGMDVKEDGGIIDDYPFFGKIKEHAPCCSSFSFAIFNTVDYEWYNSTLLDKACDAAMSTGTTDSDSTVINNLIVVAHSMGNNMFASALAEGKCSIGRNVDWVALSGPMKGSMGSDFIHEICDGNDEGSPDIWSKLGDLIGQCPGSITRRSLVYEGGEYCDRKMSARYAAAREMHEKHATASMCGTTYNGLFSNEYAGLLAGGLIIPHHSSKNDGVVEFQSCVGDLDASLFEATYQSAWYAAKLDHADTTFHDGEGLFSKAQKPLKWFECLL